LLCHAPSRRKHHPTSGLAVNQSFVLNVFSQKPKYAASDQLPPVRLAGRRGSRKAAVATARKIAVLMLTIWKYGADYQWTKEATA